MTADDWRPTADLEALRGRAEILRRVRSFFENRGVLEVETPILGSGAVPDLHLWGPQTRLEIPGEDAPRPFWLRTSPELALKRLLAAGSGPVFEIARCVRDGEAGRLHNPEFTLLEWYRPGWDHHRLMGEVEDLLSEILEVPRADRKTFAELFEPLGVDPHRASVEHLAEVASGHGLDIRGLETDGDRDTWLQVFLTHLLEPELGRGRPTVVHDFPASQAALARLRRRNDGVEVAERFEVWVEGVELANGYHELVDADEQVERFRRDVTARREAGLPVAPLDDRFLAALREGMPLSAGVALGLDRLVLLALERVDLAAIWAFPIDRC